MKTTWLEADLLFIRSQIRGEGNRPNKERTQKSRGGGRCSADVLLSCLQASVVHSCGAAVDHGDAGGQHLPAGSDQWQEVAAI